MLFTNCSCESSPLIGVDRCDELILETNIASHHAQHCRGDHIGILLPYTSAGHTLMLGTHMNPNANWV